MSACCERCNSQQLALRKHSVHCDSCFVLDHLARSTPLTCVLLESALNRGQSFVHVFQSVPKVPEILWSRIKKRVVRSGDPTGSNGSTMYLIWRRTKPATAVVQSLFLRDHYRSAPAEFTRLRTRGRHELCKCCANSASVKAALLTRSAKTGCCTSRYLCSLQAVCGACFASGACPARTQSSTGSTCAWRHHGMWAPSGSLASTDVLHGHVR